MPPALTLLDDVRWRGMPVAGDRPRTLLALLADHAPHGVSDAALVATVWGDQPPANPSKALQVVVSRTRSATSPDIIIRTDHGYRLGVAPDEVDLLLAETSVSTARAALAAENPLDAVAAARHAVDLGVSITGDDAHDVVEVIRDRARAAYREARILLGRALSRTGDHAEALPLLETTTPESAAVDQTQLADLLRSEADQRSAAMALDRYERFRLALADHLGTDPGPELQRVHRDLLAADRPVREGLRFGQTPLLGRDDDIRAVHAHMRASRVTSIVGVGGLGKTRLAHEVGHDADDAHVHVVELAGVTAPEDLIGEVGSALGIRDSVTGHHRLTPQQRAAVRVRVAQRLDATPSLLILDNCEHLVEAVADLVAFLTAATRDLRVLTTSRSPLAIAAERVYPLGQLDVDTAVELFRQRARAARPTVTLDEAIVTEIVERLDGLPLAIELAAARVRAMTVDDIACRLNDRFTLLHGGDRSAPDRHRTLLAVIDWSWNLLTDAERRAMRWLSVFHDGFTLAAAETLIGTASATGQDTLNVVQSLVDQSLLTAVETESGMRYRMLETVREFGLRQLMDAGEDGAARAAHRGWARDFSDDVFGRLHGPGQTTAMDAVRTEETNLADVLRQTLSEPDPASMVVVLSVLAEYWSITGDHSRVVALTDAVIAALADWDPPPGLADYTRFAMGTVLIHGQTGSHPVGQDLRTRLTELGMGGTAPRIDAVVAVVLADVPDDPRMTAQNLDELTADPDRFISALALQFAAFHRESVGDVAGAIDAIERGLALVRDEDGPWARAVFNTFLAQLHAQNGDLVAAVPHAAAAAPVLDRLGNSDDAMDMRGLLATGALRDGRLDEAADIARGLGGWEDRRATLCRSTVELVGAELLMARGEVDDGLQEYRATVDRLRSLPYQDESDVDTLPWVVVSTASALTAHARYASEGDSADLAAAISTMVGAAIGAPQPCLDYPMAGIAMFALGSWGLLRSTLPAETAIRLLVLADAFGYNRSLPTMDWQPMADAAEDAKPGYVARLRAEFGDRRGPDLLEEARRTVAEAGLTT